MSPDWVALYGLMMAGLGIVLGAALRGLLRRQQRQIYLVDDVTPETIGVFTSLDQAFDFARDVDADRIRVGRLDSRVFAAIAWERNYWTHELERASDG